MKPGRFSGVWVPLLLIAGAGLAAYGNTLQNRALFHHVPHAYGDPVLDNTMLKSFSLLPKVFASDFLLATYGEYRPLGYAVFALINGVMPETAHWPWHVLLILLHVAGALFVFLAFRTLVKGAVAAALSVAYVVHPAFAPFVNDVNMFYFLWGLLFSAATVWLFLVYLRTDSALALLLSIASFATSVFTFSYALIVPAFLVALCLHHEARPRGASVMLVYMALAAFIAATFGLPVLIALIALSAVPLVVSAVASVGKDRYFALAKLLPPYVAVVVLFLLVSRAIEPREVHRLALHSLRLDSLQEPFQPPFLWRTMFGTSGLYLVSILLVLHLPLLRIRSRFSYAAAIIPLSLLLALTTLWNTIYRNDVRYWGHMASVAADFPPAQLNLAAAQIERGECESARDILMHLAYETDIHMAYDDEPAVTPFPLTVQSKLARAFAGMGEDKIAGFYFFSSTRGQWAYRVMKHPLMEAADHSFRLGYLSTAEYDLASALVLDPYDLRLYNSLGRILVYRNFFRAAERYFKHVLSVEPDNVTALYHLAFVAQLLDKEKEHELYVSRWQAATHSESPPDFQPLYDGFRFDRERMRDWFSSNPLDMFAFVKDFRAEYKGNT